MLWQKFTKFAHLYLHKINDINNYNVYVNSLRWLKGFRVMVHNGVRYILIHCRGKKKICTCTFFHRNQ